MTDLDDPLRPPAARPLWLMTLADLALLLVGFLLLVQATGDRQALARGLRAGFDAPAEAPLSLAATAVVFAPGSAALRDPAPLIAWSRDALADPRVAITITGAATPGEGSVLLATDRARAVAAALARVGLPGDRLTLATTQGNPRVTLTLAFAGEPARSLP